jgi:hypothetical protein
MTPISLPHTPNPEPNETATGFDVDSDTPKAPQSTLRLFLSSLLRRYRVSTIRLVVNEIRCFPLRISAILDDPLLRYGYTFHVHQWDDGIGSLDEESKYSRVCISRIQELQASHRWAGPIDLNLALYMHRKGALWVIHNYGNKTDNTQHNRPSENNTPLTGKDVSL